MAGRYKLIVNVPLTHADAVRRAMGKAGAGKVGNYTQSSFSVRGLGRFLPGAGANPHTGEPGRLETVEEEQIQVDVLHGDIKAVLSALRESHPYEEIGYEIYPVLSADDF